MFLSHDKILTEKYRNYFKIEFNGGGWQSKITLHTQPYKTFWIVTFSPRKLKTLIDVAIINVLIDCICKVVLNSLKY